MTKKNVGKIALPAAKSAIERVKSTGPPNVSIENARKILGPELYRMMTQGWLDDDIVAALADQNENDLRQLLDDARRDERRKRRDRKKAKIAAKANQQKPEIQNSSVLVANQSRTQGLGAAPMLTTHRSTAPSLALPPPLPAPVGREITPSSEQANAHPPTGAPRTITRNRGVRRPD